MRYTLPLFPVPTIGRFDESKPIAYTISCGWVQTRCGNPSALMRYRSDPPEREGGAAGAGTGGVIEAAFPPVLGAPPAGLPGAGWTVGVGMDKLEVLLGALDFVPTAAA